MIVYLTCTRCYAEVVLHQTDPIPADCPFCLSSIWLQAVDPVTAYRLTGKDKRLLWALTIWCEE